MIAITIVITTMITTTKDEEEEEEEEEDEDDVLDDSKGLETAPRSLVGEDSSAGTRSSSLDKDEAREGYSKRNGSKNKSRSSDSGDTSSTRNTGRRRRRRRRRETTSTPRSQFKSVPTSESRSESEFETQPSDRVRDCCLSSSESFVSSSYGVTTRVASNRVVSTTASTFEVDAYSTTVDQFDRSFNDSRNGGLLVIPLLEVGRTTPIMTTTATTMTTTTTKKNRRDDGTFATTSPSKDVAELRRRQMRHTPDKCEKFQVGDEVKREFYSPNYPNHYPNHTECIRVLEADKGMLLKLDFRDEFKLEDSAACRFDFLEVRDGKHGYSNLLGKFCGSNFPPEITSKTRYLWLRFQSDENIEDKGFKAVWSMIPRPTNPGVPQEEEPCIVNVTGFEAIIQSSDVEDRRKIAEKEGTPLDCMWVINVNEGRKIQLIFPENCFKLQRPNECDANFLDIFEERTDLRSRLKNFCGSIADSVTIKTNLAFVRFYAEPKALNSSFMVVMTETRDKDAVEGSCRSDEYDCEDTTCIAANLQCNGRINCRFRWDEEDSICNKKKSSLIDSQHIVIILVVFSLIVFGMSFAFVFNCVRKLLRDHRIIQEHIRQSRENRLDELGRKTTPCPLSASRTDLGDRDSESPSLEVVPSKEILPTTTLIAQDYAKDLAMEMTYNNRDMHDIHQSNNVSNATQERLQESSEEPEMRDNSCQTRESLFEMRVPDAVTPPAFTTFGFRASGSQNGTNSHQYHRHHHQHYHPQQQQSPRLSHRSPPFSHQSSLQSQHSSQQQQGSQCSGCSPASRGRDGSMGVCPKHNPPIPAPPGWSTHESSYPSSMLHRQSGQYPEPGDYPSSYQRFHSPKPSSREDNNAYRHSPQFVRQNTIGSGERYGSSIYGSGPASSNTTSSSATSKQASGGGGGGGDPRYRAEAVIEVEQRRPFSIESTKSAPDVIATH